MSKWHLSPDELRRAASHLPRVDLAHLPTPLEEVPRFADFLDGGVRIFVKRDDCTGTLFGGNKTRHNEFILGEVLRRDCDCVVWGAGIQSNNCRQTAAACAHLGLDCYLCLCPTGHGTEVQGNLLLDYLVGAHVEIVNARLGPELELLLHERGERLRAEGRRPFVWNKREIRPLGAISYALCLAEIIEQMRRRELEPDAIYVATTGTTAAGLILGKAVLGLSAHIRAVYPLRWGWDVRADLADVANEAAALLRLPHRFTPQEVDATEAFVGPGYGVLTEQAREAFRLMATYEGILLDPVYTAKALAALIDDVRQHHRKPGSNLVFIHTGGQPAVFAYREDLWPVRS